MVYTSQSQFITGGNQGRNLKAETADSETMKEGYLLACSWSAAFLIPHRTTGPRVVPTTPDWAFLHQSLMKKMLLRLAYRSIFERYPLT